MSDLTEKATFSDQNSPVAVGMNKEPLKEKVRPKCSNVVYTTGYERSENGSKTWTCLSSESRNNLALNKREQKV